MQCIENSIISHLLWEDCLAIQMYLFQSVCFFISIFPALTNSSKQINGYEIPIVKNIPSSKREFFLSVFVASHPKHPQGKHNWTETSQDWETVQKTSSFHSWQEKCSENMCKRNSHPLKYYLSFWHFHYSHWNQSTGIPKYPTEIACNNNKKKGQK